MGVAGDHPRRVGVARDRPQRVGISATILITAVLTAPSSVLTAHLQSDVEKAEESPQEEKPNDNDLEVRPQRIIVHTENKHPRMVLEFSQRVLKHPQVCRR